jgi:heavy metal sensor kinase
MVMFNAVHVRLTLWYIAVLALVLIAFSLGVSSFFARSLYNRLDSTLQAVLEAVVVSLGRETMEGETYQKAAVSTVRELFFPHHALAIFDAEGRLLAEQASQDHSHAPVLEAGPVPTARPTLYTVDEPATGEDHRCRVALQRVEMGAAAEAYVVVVSRSLTAVTKELALLRHILSAAVPLALLFTGLGGWFLARKSLAPVMAMAQQAQRIGAATLDQRLPVANPHDELGHLAASFNALLSRLSDAFARQRQFMADASHELRTPLSVVHTTTAVTLERAQRTEGEYRDALKIITEQTRRLTRIVEDMFLLARADAGHQPLHPSQFYLDELLAEAARAASVLSARKGVAMVLAPGPEALYHGDHDLLRQMLLNLLDNAIKYTPPGGSIHVCLQQHATQYRITVADTGIGIPPEAQPHLFERFYRVDQARTRTELGNGSGAGLGLAIARWIAEAHDGRLELQRSDHTGSVFVAVLPTSHTKCGVRQAPCGMRHPVVAGDA